MKQKNARTQNKYINILLKEMKITDDEITIAGAWLIYRQDTLWGKGMIL